MLTQVKTTVRKIATCHLNAYQQVISELCSRINKPVWKCCEAGIYVCNCTGYPALNLAINAVHVATLNYVLLPTPSDKSLWCFGSDTQVAHSMYYTLSYLFVMADMTPLSSYYLWSVVQMSRHDTAGIRMCSNDHQCKTSTCSNSLDQFESYDWPCRGRQDLSGGEL
jgi:hypothetical protein